MKKIFFSCLLIFSFSAHAQITFQKTYGDTAGASGRSILVTSDGGYLISGFLGVYVPLGLNACLIKIDELGDTLWTTLFRSQDWAEVYSAASTFDGGYILTGIHRPIGYGFPNIFLVKLDLNGAIQWSKSISKTPLDVSDYGISLQQTNDSGYIVTGWTWNPTGSGSNDICLIKTDGNGNLIWFKTYGEYNSDEYGESVQQTLDGGYVLCGYTYPQPMGPGEIYL